MKLTINWEDICEVSQSSSDEVLVAETPPKGGVKNITIGGEAMPKKKAPGKFFPILVPKQVIKEMIKEIINETQKEEGTLGTQTKRF